MLYNHFIFFAYFSIYIATANSYIQIVFYTSLVPFQRVLFVENQSKFRIMNACDELNTCFLSILSFSFYFHIHRIFLFPKSNFFSMTFFVLKCLFWMTIILRIWNSNSKSIWWVKDELFVHFIIFAHLSVYTLLQILIPKQYSFGSLLPYKWSIFKDNQFKISKFEIWNLNVYDR